MPIVFEPVGWVRGGRTQPYDDDWDTVRACIELNTERFAPDSLTGLEAFSHATIVFHFHRQSVDDIVSGARHPRGRVDWPKVGIFSQRGKARPNRIGVSVCRILGVEGVRLRVQGLDAIDGTPVLDIKPYMQGFSARGDVHEPDWAHQIMSHYWVDPQTNGQ